MTRLRALLVCGFLLGCRAKSDRPNDPEVPGLEAGRAVASVAPPARDAAISARAGPRPSAALDSSLPLARIRLPQGFRIGLYASGIKGARSLALASDGTLFVGTKHTGRVYAILNADGDAQADRVLTLAEGLHVPNGVALHDGALFVAEQNRILRFDDIAGQLARLVAEPPQKPHYRVLNDSFPDRDEHGWKFIAVGPDQELYVPIGAPCNLCDDKDRRFASITRLGLDGKGFEIFARGVRNTVGFDWHPQTKELWFTDNGRDRMGDDVPPDELNRAPRAGLHFGYPYCHAGTLQDPEFGKKMACSETTPPVQKLGPHVAALGMRFYTGSKFPPRYQQQIFIAEHGSWDRREKLGYRIMLVRLEGNDAKSYEVFADGWLHDGEVWGRPVDLLVTPDGALLISDDEAHAIYRISYEG